MNKEEQVTKINKERIQEIKNFRALLKKFAAEGHLMLEPQRGYVRDVLASGDRETKKSSIALKIVDDRYRECPNEYFIYVVLNDNMKTDVINSFYHLGWNVNKNKVYDPFKNNKLIGFIAAINTYNKEKLKMYRFFNITTAIWEELVPELERVPSDLGKKISSVITSIFGDWKLKKWKELNIINYFLTNNHNSDYPLFYLYGEPKEEMGVTYGVRRKIPFAIVSLVHHKEDEEIDPLLTLSGYDEGAWGNGLTLNKKIYVDDVNLDEYEFLMNIEIFTTKCSIYFNDEEILIYHKINKEDEEIVLVASHDGLKQREVNLNVLRKINNAFNSDSLMFSRWHLRSLVNEAMLKYASRI